MLTFEWKTIESNNNGLKTIHISMKIGTYTNFVRLVTDDTIHMVTTKHQKNDGDWGKDKNYTCTTF